MPLVLLSRLGAEWGNKRKLNLLCTLHLFRNVSFVAVLSQLREVLNPS